MLSAMVAYSVSRLTCPDRSAGPIRAGCGSESTYDTPYVEAGSPAGGSGVSGLPWAHNFTENPWDTSRCGHKRSTSLLISQPDHPHERQTLRDWMGVSDDTRGRESWARSLRSSTQTDETEN